MRHHEGMGQRRDRVGTETIVRRLAFLHAPTSPVNAVAELLVLEHGDWVVQAEDPDWRDRIALVAETTPAKDGNDDAAPVRLGEDAVRWADFARHTFRSPYLMASPRDPATGERFPDPDPDQRQRFGEARSASRSTRNRPTS